MVFGRVLSDLDGMIYHQGLSRRYDGIVPAHGPGATADSLYGNQKWLLPEWHERLESLFPYLEYGLPNHSYWEDAQSIRYLAPDEEQPVKLTAVPKTQRTPRLIAIEPTCMQYIQQGISRPLCSKLEEDGISSRFVGFTEQEPNQVLARIGSEDGSLATLDLSEASDRVPFWLVDALYENYPHFSEGISICRSTRVELPNGHIMDLRKFASMGSALTFPIEAMVFSAIVLASLVRANRLPVTLTSIKRFSDMVRVYGDDIIVPVDMAETVIDSLEIFGFKVNRNKSFWTGEFRESCGKEYWKGHDVSIVKVRKALPSSRRDVDEIVSTVATRNLFFKAGLRDTAAFLDELIEPILRFYPFVKDTSPILGRVRDDDFYQVDLMDQNTHSPKVKGWTVVPKIPENGISGRYALLKCFTGNFSEPNADPEHLTRSGRPRVVSIKLVKSSPF